MGRVKREGTSQRRAAVAAAFARRLAPRLACVLIAAALPAAADPVIQSALSPVDISKLLSSPSSSLSASPAWADGASVGRRPDLGLSPSAPGHLPFATRAEQDLQAAATEVLASPAADARPPRPSPQAASAEPNGPRRQDTTPPVAARELAQQGDPLLLNDALRELRDSSEFKDLKEFWRDTSAELKQFRGGLLFEAPSEAELEQRRSSRQRSDLSGVSEPGAGITDPNARPRSEAELRRDSVLASVMLKQLVDELTPWVIGIVLSYLLGRAAWAYWRLQKSEQRRRKSSARHMSGARRRSSSSSSSASRGVL